MDSTADLTSLPSLPSNPQAISPSATSSQTQGSRQRIITSCLTCRRRKVKCDHKHPICGACSRGNHICYYANVPQSLSRRSPSTSSAAGRVSKLASHAKGQASAGEINARLERLESLLERAVQKGSAAPTKPDARLDLPDRDERINSSMSPRSSISDQQVHAADSYDGTLLVADGQSHFVSSLHWALLTDEIQDIKSLLSSENRSQAGDEFYTPSTSRSLLFSSGHVFSDTSKFMPENQTQCYELLQVFYQNVDPVARLIHKPSVNRRFNSFMRRYKPLNSATPLAASDNGADDFCTEEQMQNFEPLAFAIFFAAINSLRPEVVAARFEKDKHSLLRMYQRGAELALERVDFLTTSNTEVLQAFVLLLMCQAREDDMSQTWPLTGVAIRIAMLQGLHREPSLFSVTEMDEVQVETRRRTWHQICHLDWRATEGKGMEPTLRDDDFTTMLPRNVNDTDLVEGRLPPPGLGRPEEEGFTEMTLQICHLTMVQCFRKIAQGTYRLERRVKAAKMREGSQFDIRAELRTLFRDTKSMIDKMHEKVQRCYIRHCRLDVLIQRLTVGLSATLEWRCWLLFWCGVPKEMRGDIIASGVRAMIFNRSISLVDSLNNISADREAENFQWHIGAHAAFQAIMHVLCELRDPQFPTANHPETRMRALKALHTAYRLKGRPESNTWTVIRRMIDKLDPNGECNIPYSRMGNDRFGEHDLTSIFLANSPDSKMPIPPRAPPVMMPLGPKDYDLIQSPTSAEIVQSLELAGANAFDGPLDPPYVSNGAATAPAVSPAPTVTPSVPTTFPDIERTSIGVDMGDTVLQDIAMDMDWGFWNYDPLQFDAGFSPYANPGAVNNGGQGFYAPDQSGVR